MENNNRYFFEANRQAWNLRTGIHLHSDFYNVVAWKSGQTSLTPIELAEMGDVSGKSLLHLQCHFGQDTLSWARLGAKVTGVDLSDAAIAEAQKLALEMHLPARFMCCNVYDLPDHLDETFDIVFTSYGVVGWLPDLVPWARLIARYLKPGGVFYLAEFHPIVWMFDDQFEKFAYPYHNSGVIETENKGTYTDKSGQGPVFKDYGWNHGLSEVISSLTAAGLVLEFLHEFPYSPYNCFAKTVKDEAGNYRIQGLENIIPMVYSIRAHKP